jgi:hypothetical protein
MDQLIQIVGAVLILIAFIAAQAGRLSPHAVSYVVLNLVGSLVLTGIALHNGDLGFLLLEAVWAIVSAWSLVQLARGRQPTAAH